MRIYCTAVIVLLGSLQAISQDKFIEPGFYQHIAEDSIILFFNDRYHLIEKACVQNVRLIGLNKQGKFDGYFEDLTLQDRLLGKGHYVDGEKDGYFEIYYPTGGVRVKGFYKNNKAFEQWEYFYENGSLERRLKITASDTLLMEYIDAEGNVLVKNGNGQFKGPVNALMGASEHYITAEGLVVNGKPHGNWIGMGGDDWLFCNEEFELGKYLGGTAPGSRRKKQDHLRHLNKFILKDYFQLLDNFFTERCSDSSRYGYKPSRQVEASAIHSRAFDTKRFNSFLREAVKRSIDHDMRMNSSDNYKNVDYTLTIRFSVSKDGKAENLSVITAWGSQFLSEIRNCMNSHATFPGSGKEMYFHMKFSFQGDAMYTYRYAFSNSALNQL